MNLWESAWVIARRDFVASVFSRFFILFLLAPIVLVGFMIFFNIMTERQDRAASQPVVAVVTRMLPLATPGNAIGSDVGALVCPLAVGRARMTLPSEP